MGATTSRSARPSSLAAKLAEVTAEVRRVEERGVNPTFRYRFATAADLIDEIRGKLASRSVALIPSVERVDRIPLASRGGEIRTTNKGAAIVLTRVRMNFLFADGESGETMTFAFEGEGADEGDKGLNKAYTAAQKYFLRQAFLVPLGDDPESDDDRTAPAGANRTPAGSVSADPPRPTEPLASARQRVLVMARASEAGLSAYAFANALMAVGGRPPREWGTDEAALNFVQRAVDRLPARKVDDVLAAIERARPQGALSNAA